MKRIILALLVSPLILTACATSPEDISAAYVSPLKYQKYDCDQLALELDYVGQRTNRLFKSLEDEADSDAWQMGVGMIIFWPALFALEGGDGPEATEYAQLKGEFEALRTMAVQKKCGIEAKSPQEMMEEKKAQAKKKKS